MFSLIAPSANDAISETCVVRIINIWNIKIKNYLEFLNTPMFIIWNYIFQYKIFLQVCCQNSMTILHKLHYQSNHGEQNDDVNYLQPEVSRKFSNNTFIVNRRDRWFIVQYIYIEVIKTSWLFILQNHFSCAAHVLFPITYTTDDAQWEKHMFYIRKVI